MYGSTVAGLGIFRYAIRYSNDRVLLQGSPGFGESYMDGAWESECLDETFHKLLRARLDDKIKGFGKFRFLGLFLRNVLFNRQSRKRAFQVGEHHYDIGNDVYAAMLDPTMSYSCGYWKDAEDLERAQLAKLCPICDKLGLKAGERLLDIGCGWGGLAKFAAQGYGVEVTGITVSKEQQRFAQASCAGLLVSIELMDYRDLSGCFDKAVSVGMFEHVGPKNYPAYFAAVERVMVPDGLFLLHTIGDYDHRANHGRLDRQVHRFPTASSPRPGSSAGPSSEASSSRTGTTSARTTTPHSWPGGKISTPPGRASPTGTTSVSTVCSSIT